MLKETKTKTEREKMSDLYFLKLGKFTDGLTSEQVGELIDLLNLRDQYRHR
tara:strand:+ start:270 stop:422 length:153 start_codon:yes stop_codon:yes gene_type:complete